jgi:hypothetical protein
MDKKHWIIKNQQDLPGYVAWLAPDGKIDLVDLRSAWGRYPLPLTLECVSHALSRPVYRALPGVSNAELLQVAAELIVLHFWAQHTTCDWWIDVVAKMSARRNGDSGRIGKPPRGGTKKNNCAHQRRKRGYYG